MAQNVTVFYVGSSLLAPLRQAEAEIARLYGVPLRVAAHNFGAPFDEDGWEAVERDLAGSDVVFVIHVTDGENAARLLPLLSKYEPRHGAVVVINCMPELMRRTRMGRLSFNGNASSDSVEAEGGGRDGAVRRAVKGVGSWMGAQAKARRGKSRGNHSQYLRYIERLPAILRLVPGVGRLGDFKHYLQLFCYFLQPTPANVRSMLLYALKHYGGEPKLAKVRVPPPETMPAVGVYHPDAPALFDSSVEYRKWHAKRARKKSDLAPLAPLAPENTIGLLLMRPQIVSRARGHYDALIRAVEREGLAVLPAISTFMDNREACEKFFVGADGRPLVSQIVSLTGFSFVGGPAMNDSEAAVEFLKKLGVPFRSAVSLDVQTVESWRESWTGLNPVQAGMQVAIPEIDGATEPFVFGGISSETPEPVPLEGRCRRVAKRLKRWQHLQTAPRGEVKLALVVFCFPSDRGNVGTAADLDVFQSLWETLVKLKAEGYAVELPGGVDELRESLLEDSEGFGTAARVEYKMRVDEYRRLCPHVEEIEAEWGRAPGAIDTFAGTLLVQGLRLGNVFVGVQPTFGYEGDPMKMLMARNGAPHHGFAAFYTFVEKIFKADAVVHLGTHGALEFMPGKQVGLSDACWPDRMIGELPHVYVYSVNNPSEGTIARRRSYAELISYLTPPVEDAGLYRGLVSLKDLLLAYRQTTDEDDRRRLYEAIESQAEALHFEAA